jgi:thiol-disulfide isomerase/thioredoxin
MKTYSQEDSPNKGIVFENHLTWQQVVQKAKADNKYIFVDCYASWCGPCKWMDQHVYTNDTVGDFVNKSFVAVKVQMDTTRHDVAGIMAWYTSAHEMDEQYRIRAYPTYLFFSPDGQAVHKAIGAADVRDFLALARAAMDPRQQYYTLLTQYERGTQQYGLMPYLINTAKRVYDDSLSSVIAVDYLNYLGGLADKDLWTKDNIEFIGTYGKVIHYGDKIFQRYLRAKVQIDSIIGSAGYADRLINEVAYNEEISPGIDAGIKDDSEPNWHLMTKMIKKKYGAAFVRENMLIGKEEYYRSIKKWDKYATYFVLHMQSADIENWPPGRATSLGLNNNAFEVFKYSKRRKELEEALSWIDRALTMNVYQVQELDTKANLLYKLGRNNEAITWEEKSHNLAPGDKDIQANYEKMKNGQPTW